MSENACYALLVGRTSTEVCQAVVAQAALQGRLSFQHGLEIVPHDEEDWSVCVQVEWLDCREGVDVVQISAQSWESSLLDLTALNRRLGGSMMCERVFSQGISHETSWFLHEGEELFREGETAEGDLFVECPALGIHLSQATPEERRAARLRIVAWLRERVGAVVDALLDADDPPESEEEDQDRTGVVSETT